MTDKNITLSDADIQWHPAFCAAAELELSANRTDLDFQREYNLSKKPPQKRRFPAMHEALKMLMWDEIEDEVQKQARQTAYKLHDMGMPADKIARAVSVSLETVQKWFAERAAQAKPAAPL